MLFCAQFFYHSFYSPKIYILSKTCSKIYCCFLFFPDDLLFIFEMNDHSTVKIDKKSKIKLFSFIFISAQNSVQDPVVDNFFLNPFYIIVLILSSSEYQGDESGVELKKLVLIFTMGCYIFSDEPLGDNCRYMETTPNRSPKYDSKQEDNQRC